MICVWVFYMVLSLTCNLCKFPLRVDNHFYSKMQIEESAHVFCAQGPCHNFLDFNSNGEAIQLDENLLHCRTEHCDTFDNPPLCSDQDFTCKVVEVYGFQ